MNKLFLYLTIALVGALTFIGCESNTTGGVPERTVAPMVTLEEISSPEIDLTDPSASLTMLINKAGDNTASVVYKISQSADITTAVTWKTIDTFPSEHTITMAEITSLIGTVAPGRIYFHAEVTGEDGNVVTFANLTLTGDFANPGQAQGMRFDVIAFCNYNPATTAGTYELTSTLSAGSISYFGITLGQRTIVANSDHIIIREFYGPGLPDLRIEVSPTGSLSLASRQVMQNNPASGVFAQYGALSFDRINAGTGTLFSCTGTLSFASSPVVAAGRFGAQNYRLTKIN